MRHFLAITLALCSCLIAKAQPGRDHYLDIYREAESLFDSETPTADSDSIAIEKYQRVARGLLSDSGSAVYVFKSYQNIGTLHQVYERYNEAVTAYHRAIWLAKQWGMSDSLLYEPYLYTGNSYFYLHTIDSALHYFKKAEPFIDRYALDEEYRLYNSFGAAYFEAGNYVQSANYFSKSLQIFRRAG